MIKKQLLCCYKPSQQAPEEPLLLILRISRTCLSQNYKAHMTHYKVTSTLLGAISMAYLLGVQAAKTKHIRTHIFKKLYTQNPKPEKVYWKNTGIEQTFRPAESTMMPSGAYVVPVTLYSAETGPRWAERTTHTCQYPQWLFGLKVRNSDHQLEAWVYTTTIKHTSTKHSAFIISGLPSLGYFYQ